MKNYWSLSLFALLLLAASGCKDDNPITPANPDFKVTFRATYDGAALEKAKDYPYDDFMVRFDQFQLALSDVTLLKGNQEVRLTESEYFDFMPDNSTTNLSQTFERTYAEQVAPGQYTGFKIGFGVKPVLNAKKPADFSSTDPLYSADYWSSWQSYIFMKVIGTANRDNLGQPNLDLVYHCGGDPSYQVFTFDHPISVTEDGGSMTVTFDLKKLFTLNGAPYDIEAKPTFSHNANDVALMTELMAQFRLATVVQ